MLLTPRPEILLFGEDSSIREICREFGLKQLRVDQNSYGTPFLNDMFNKAQGAARFDLLCYVNADIVLTSDFIRMAQKIASWKECVAVGGRIDIDVDLFRSLDLDSQDPEKRLRDLAATKGSPMVAGSDYFLFPKGFFSEMPPFAIGRTCFDNWLFWQTRHRNLPLVDATEIVLALHPKHTSPAQWTKISNGPEALENRRLARTWPRSYTIADATHRLGPAGFRSRWFHSALHRLGMARMLLEQKARASARTLLRPLLRN